MQSTERLTLDDKDRKDIYEYIERHGRVSADEVRRTLGFDETAFGHHVAVLRRDGYVHKTGGDLEVAYTDDMGEAYESDELEFTIRFAQQFDLSGLIGVIRQVAQSRTYIEAEAVADILDYEEVVIRHSEVGSRMFFVAVVDDEVIGWVHLDLPQTEKLRHTAVLTVGVLEEYQGHGIGTALLERGTEWATNRGFEKLYNSVPASNEDAVDFLEAHGWRTEAVRTGHYRIDGEYVDEVMMAYDI
ncbi:GNAT family N-acetyltransferase [Haloferacaceae archaeon DSL9]